MSKVVRKAVEQDHILSRRETYADEVIDTGFEEDTGRATAVLKIDCCLTNAQVEAIRDSDTWELDFVSPRTDTQVAVHLIETMEQEA